MSRLTAPHLVRRHVLYSFLALAIAVAPLAAQQPAGQKMSHISEVKSAPAEAVEYLRMCVTALNSLEPEGQQKANTCESLFPISGKETEAAKTKAVAKTRISSWNGQPIVELTLKDGRRLVHTGQGIHLLPKVEVFDAKIERQMGGVTCSSIGPYFSCWTATTACHWYGDRLIYCGSRYSLK